MTNPRSGDECRHAPGCACAANPSPNRLKLPGSLRDETPPPSNRRHPTNNFQNSTYGFIMSSHATPLRTLLRFNADVLGKMAPDLTEDLLDKPMVHGGNTPRWVLAHLAVGLDFALLAIGKPALLPRTWLVLYGPGSSGNIPEPRPSREELLAAIAQATEALDAALTELETPTPAAAERLARPHDVKLLAGTPLTTIGDVISYLVAAHFALHIGQLSLVRRQAGRKPIL